MVAWNAWFSLSRSSPACLSCTVISAISALRESMASVRSLMVLSSVSIWASSSCFARSFFSVCSWFSENPLTQKSLCLISTSFSLRSAAIMSSIAFFTRSNASSFTRVARLDNRGLCSLAAARASIREACSRREEPVLRRTCASVGLNVLVNTSWDSSELRIASAFETASISRDRVFWRVSHSESVMEHLSFSSMRNFWSAPREFLVSSMSVLELARRWSVSASSCVLLLTCSCPAATCASFAALSSSYAFWFAISSFWVSDMSFSKVSFICCKIPKISPDCGA
mmetsp:Transcript_31812/g.85143  ORF Transcript_31812/g.85143 Transcript_31812/m.85143 type:complete len:284 (+) Transcript_31812:626-1477(+)